jgi:hypothetical protein
MSRQFGHCRFDHPKYIWRDIQIRNLVIGQKATKNTSAVYLNIVDLKNVKRG